MEFENACLENAVNLDLILRADLLLDKEFAHNFPLVAGQLQDVTVCLIVNDCAVAAERLLEILQHLLHVEILRKSLDDGQRLPAISLLDPDMNLLNALVLWAIPSCKGGVEIWGVNALEGVNVWSRQCEMVLQPTFSFEFSTVFLTVS